MHSIKFRKYKTDDGFKPRYLKFIYTLKISDIFRVYEKQEEGTKIYTYLVLDRVLLDCDPKDGTTFEPQVPYYTILCLEDKKVLNNPIVKHKTVFYELLA